MHTCSDAHIWARHIRAGIPRLIDGPTDRARRGDGPGDPEVVWALVSDADQYPRWGPWIASGYKKLGDTSPHGVGAVQWFRASERTYLR
jgi:hypothetical protein